MSMVENLQHELFQSLTGMESEYKPWKEVENSKTDIIFFYLIKYQSPLFASS